METPDFCGNAAELEAMVREIDQSLAAAIAHDNAQLKRLTNLLKEVNHFVNEWERTYLQPNDNDERLTIPMRAKHAAK